MGGEQYLTIGNFSSGNIVNHKLVLPHNSNPNTLGYYSFDDVSIYEQPEVNAGNDTLIPPGDSVQLGIAGRSDIFYSWQPIAGLSNPNISNPMATPGISTTYTLTVTDTNSLACTSVFTDSVKVLLGFLGVKELRVKNVEFKVFPNPVKEELIVSREQGIGKESFIIIYDVLGNKVLELKNYDVSRAIDISGLEDGVYFIGINNTTKRIVVLILNILLDNFFHKHTKKIPVHPNRHLGKYLQLEKEKGSSFLILLR